MSDDQLVSIIFGGKRNHAWRKFEALIETVLPPEDFGPEGRWATSSPEEVAFQVLAEAVTRISSGEEIEAPFRPLRELQLAG